MSLTPHAVLVELYEQKIDVLKKENMLLRQIISDCCKEGTDGFASPQCSLTFLGLVPNEIKLTRAREKNHG